MMRRRDFIAATAAAALTTPARGADDAIVMTGHLGNIGSRLWPLLPEPKFGIDRKEGPEFDLSRDRGESWFSRVPIGSVVVHLAAHAGADGRRDIIQRDNIEATYNLVNRCARLDVRHIVFASSPWRDPHLYGHPTFEPGATTYYGASKRWAEQFLWNIAREGKIRVTIVVVGYAPHDEQPRGDAWANGNLVTTTKLAGALLGDLSAEVPPFTFVEMVGPKRRLYRLPA
jgi:nucleoside-diphosphate-sugar epimerase